MKVVRRRAAAIRGVLFIALGSIAAVAAATVVVPHVRGIDGVGRAGPTSSVTAPVTSAGTSATPAARLRYVHMGDSYGAGTGPYHLAPDAPVPCQRTTKNPARQLAQRMRWQLHDVSCASAKTENLYVEQYFGAGPQLDALNEDVQVVTVVLGANDGDFFDTLVKKCADLGATDPTGAPCRDAMGADLESTLRSQTGPNLRRAFRDIAAKAPNAELYAVGYPFLVPASGACRPALRFADGDIVFARAMLTLLNEQVRTAVEAANGVFVDMSKASEGHDACAPAQDRWIEPAYDESGEPTGLPANHPNPRGQQAMATALQAAVKRGR